jgi:hypothetical protein
MLHLATGIGLSEPPIEPSDQVAAADVTNEQEQAEDGLIQSPFAQRQGRQRASRQVPRIRAGVSALPAPTLTEMPVAP